MSAKQERAMRSLADSMEELLTHPVAQQLQALGPVLPEDEPTPTCLRCRGSGYLRRDVAPTHADFGKVFPCTCEVAQERIQRRLETIWAQCSVPPAKQVYTLDSLAKIDTTRAEFAADLRAWSQGSSLRWLVIQGPRGTCKSGGAISLLLEHVRSGGSGLYVSVPDFLKGLRKTYRQGGDGPSESEALDVLIAAGMLVLDDLGAEKLSEWGQEQLWYVIDKRDGLNTSAEPKPTIITTNLSLAELPTYLDPHARTWDRIRGWADQMQTRGASVRGTAKARAASEELPF